MSFPPPNPGLAETRRFRSRVLLGSGPVNVLLVVLLVLSPGRPKQVTDQRGSDDARRAGPNADRRAAAGGRIPERTPHPKSVWSRLESTNFLEYTANLRRAGCPDDTGGQGVSS